MIDPSILKGGALLGAQQQPRTPERFELKIHKVSPESIIPNGDRYVVEIIALNEEVEFGKILVVTQDPQMNPRDPMANPQIEQRGVLAAVIVTAGNGHLLGLPDPRVAVARQDPRASEEVLVRVPADVPMFFAPGDVVFVDMNARGRALRIVGREIRIVNQIDVLARIDGVRLTRGENGWEQE